MHRRSAQFLRATAIALFSVYCLWNAFWLLQRQVPPALFLGLTGLPAATTGCTRSLKALSAGDWGKSLRWNAMAVPLSLLFLLSLGRLAWAWIARRPVRLPIGFLYAWVGLLAIAWVLKLVGDPAYW